MGPAGARGAVGGLGAALQEPMPESEVFRTNKRSQHKLAIVRHKKRKIVVDERAAKHLKMTQVRVEKGLGV